jgi:catalase-peroxidase
VPAQALIWQDPLPRVDHPLVDAADVAALKGQILASGLTVAELVRTAWASASTFRSSDKRGGANGARIRLAPQKDWEANRPQELAKVLAVLETVQRQFNGRAAGGKQVSRADLIVLGGIAALESAAAQGGMALTLPFTPGRSDATAEQTDAASFAVLEPQADALRNFAKPGFRSDAAQRMIDRAQLLGLSAPQLTALLGGLRALGISEGSLGVLTHRPGVLSTDFFRNLLDMGTQWRPLAAGRYEGRDRRTGAARWTATRVDLAFGSNAQLRALAEVYAEAGSEDKLVADFVAAWTKVMEADRFDLRQVRTAVVTGGPGAAAGHAPGAAIVAPAVATRQPPDQPAAAAPPARPGRAARCGP